MSVFWRVYAACYDSLWDNALTDQTAGWVQAQIQPGDEVVECGAGTGLIVQRLTQAGHHVRATEPEKAMRDRLQRRLPDVVVDGRRCEDLPAGQEAVILAVNVLHMVTDIHEALWHLRAAAGARGRVIVTVPAQGTQLSDVLAAMRTLHVPWRERARFAALHMLLAPMTVAGAHGLRRLPQDWHGAAVRVESIGSLLIGAVFSGV